MILERDIERYLIRRAKEAGGEVRKVKWIGRRNAPDRLALLPLAKQLWVEVKNPQTIKTFPANAHERAQHREHQRMRKLGLRVEVIGTFEQVDALFA